MRRPDSITINRFHSVLQITNLKLLFEEILNNKDTD